MKIRRVKTFILQIPLRTGVLFIMFGILFVSLGMLGIIILIDEEVTVPLVCIFIISISSSILGLIGVFKEIPWFLIYPIVLLCIVCILILIGMIYAIISLLFVESIVDLVFPEIVLIFLFGLFSYLTIVVLSYYMEMKENQSQHPDGVRSPRTQQESMEQVTPTSYPRQKIEEFPDGDKQDTAYLLLILQDSSSSSPVPSLHSLVLSISLQVMSEI